MSMRLLLHVAATAAPRSGHLRHGGAVISARLISSGKTLLQNRLRNCGAVLSNLCTLNCNASTILLRPGNAKLLPYQVTQAMLLHHPPLHI